MNLYEFPPYVIRVSGSGEGYDLINTETGVTELSNHPSLPHCIIRAKEYAGFFDRLRRESKSTGELISFPISQRERD